MLFQSSRFKSLSLIRFRSNKEIIINESNNTLDNSLHNTESKYDYCTICDLLHINQYYMEHCNICNKCHITNKIYCSYCKNCYDFRIDNDIIKHRKVCLIYNRLHA